VLGVDVEEVQFAVAVGAAGGVDDLGVAGGEDVHQLGGEQERGQVVDLEGGLVAVHGAQVLAHDAAGIVGQDVDPRVLLPQVRGEGADLVQFGEVADEVVGGEFLRDGPRLLLGTADDDHPVACLRQRPRGCRADAVAGAGDHDGALGQGVSFGWGGLSNAASGLLQA